MSAGNSVNRLSIDIIAPLRLAKHSKKNDLLFGFKTA